jgi:hypothetical protein
VLHFQHEQAFRPAVDAAALSRAHPGDPDDAVPVADQRHLAAPPRRNFLVDEELLEFLARGEPERPETIPRAAAPDREWRAQAGQVECHAEGIGAKCARVEPRGGSAEARRQGVSAGEVQPAGNFQGGRPRAGRARGSRRAGEQQARAVTAAADPSRQVPRSGAAAGGQERFDVAAREVSGATRDGAHRQNQRP